MEKGAWCKLSGINYNPDEFSLKKKDIIEILDAVENYWRKDVSANWQFISGLKIMKTGIKLTPEKAVAKIWNSLLRFIFHLQYQNGIQKAMKNSESWADTLSKIKNEKNIEKILEGI